MNYEQFTVITRTQNDLSGDFHFVSCHDDTIEGITFRNGVICVSHASFVNCNFHNVRFEHLFECVFSSCVFDGSDFRDLWLRNVTFVDCKGNNITFNESTNWWRADALDLGIDVYTEKLKRGKGKVSIAYSNSEKSGDPVFYFQGEKYTDRQLFHELLKIGIPNIEIGRFILHLKRMLSTK